MEGVGDGYFMMVKVISFISLYTERHGCFPYDTSNLLCKYADAC